MFPILIVDDSREDLMLAERVLHACKILNPIHCLSSGAACLAVLREFSQSDEAEEGALVLLDLQMTPISGLDVLRDASESHCGRDSIFVMLSGITDVKLLREGYQLGARTFLVKPLRADDVLEFLSSNKERIAIDESADGYSLRWAGSKPRAARLAETSQIAVLRA